MVYKKVYNPGTLSGKELDEFLAHGWFRMHQSIFTITHSFRDSVLDFCPVWWLRFPVGVTYDHRSHRRIRNRNQHFQVRVESPYHYHPDAEALYHKYLDSVPFCGYDSIANALWGGDASINQNTVFNTQAIIISDGDKDLATGILDMGEVSGSSILHFYDPEYARFSLGKYLILLTLDLLRERGCQWYYPGYVIAGDPRFDYKLFIGRDQAFYFDPADQSWKAFKEEILQKVETNPDDWEKQFGDLLFGNLM